MRPSEILLIEFGDTESRARLWHPDDETINAVLAQLGPPIEDHTQTKEDAEALAAGHPGRWVWITSGSET